MNLDVPVGGYLLVVIDSANNIGIGDSESGVYGEGTALLGFKQVFDTDAGNARSQVSDYLWSVVGRVVIRDDHINFHLRRNGRRGQTIECFSQALRPVISGDYHGKLHRQKWLNSTALTLRLINAKLVYQTDVLPFAVENKQRRQTELHGECTLQVNIYANQQ
jgi:hypothetical protein